MIDFGDFLLFKFESSHLLVDDKHHFFHYNCNITVIFIEIKHIFSSKL